MEEPWGLLFSENFPSHRLSVRHSVDCCLYLFLLSEGNEIQTPILTSASSRPSGCRSGQQRLDHSRDTDAQEMNPKTYKVSLYRNKKPSWEFHVKAIITISKDSGLLCIDIA
jgi:hypothetical protein